MNRFEKELNAALEAGILAKKIVMDIYNNGFDVEIKEDNSPVTMADKKADEAIRNYLKSRFPDYAFLTEESVDNLDRLNNDYVWIIDPVDGTKDFVAKNGQFTINIGLAYKHKAVLGVVVIPAKNLIYFATYKNGAFKIDENGISHPIHVNNNTKNLTVYLSNFHTNQKEIDLLEKHKDIITNHIKVGSSIKQCLIAEGKGEITYRVSDGTKEWDTCASQIIVEEAGGFVLKFDGTPITYNRVDVYNRGGYIIVNNKKNILL